MNNALFEKEKIHRAFFKLTMPVVLGMVITLVYNMVDTYFIALSGNTDLIAGVSIVYPMLYFMIAIGDIFGIGGSSVISRFFGQKKYEEAKNISSFCFYMAFICGIVFSALFLIIGSNMIYFLGADPNTYQYAFDYYKYLILGAPFIILTYIPTNQLRTEGYSIQTMICSAMGAVINIILDPIFIFTLNMGAAGAAIATVTGNIGTCVLFIIVILKKSRLLSINPRRIKRGFEFFKNVLYIGIPASLTNIMLAICISVTNRFMLIYGNDKIAAYGIAIKAINIAIMVVVGFSFGAQPLIGYNYGAGDRKRIKEILKFCYTFICTIGISTGIILSIFAPQIISCFVSDKTLIETGSQVVRMYMTGMLFEGICFISMCTFQAVGNGISALIISLCRQGIVYLTVIFIFSNIFGYTGILISQAVSDIITSIIAVILMRNIIKEINNMNKSPIQLSYSEN